MTQGRWKLGWAMAVLAMVAAVAAPGARAAEPPAAGTFEGQAAPLGQGEVRAFVTIGADGAVTQVGVIMTEDVLAGLPGGPPPGSDGYEITLPLPPEAASSGYDHVTVNWAPWGHAPKGVYDVAHFYMRFFMISTTERGKITATGEDRARAHRMPEARFMPAGYVMPPGTEVALAGAHAFDPAAPEFNGRPFTLALLYGFYDAQIVFLEPMVTRDFLKTKPDVTEAIKQPSAYERPGLYPAAYRVRYDPDAKAFIIALQDFKKV